MARPLPRTLRALGIVALVPLVLGTMAWSALLLRFHPPLGAPGSLAAGLVAAIGLLLAIGVATSRRRAALLAWAVLFAACLAWWGTITPRADRPWAPDVARMPVGVVEGDILTLQNVRDFSWGSREAPLAERWETRRYDLATLTSLDLVMNYWAGPHIAHGQVSFGFADGRRLIWSIEVRNLEGRSFDALAGLFATNELVYVAGEERDLIRRRTHVTREDIRIYRLQVPPRVARELLLAYVRDAEELGRTPRFYNTLTTNCTTMIAKLTRAIGITLPFDWRLVLNGHLPSYLFDRGALTPGLSLAELTARAAVTERSLAIPDDAGYSRALRVGVPGATGP